MLRPIVWCASATADKVFGGEISLHAVEKQKLQGAACQAELDPYFALWSFAIIPKLCLGPSETSNQLNRPNAGHA